MRQPMIISYRRPRVRVLLSACVVAAVFLFDSAVSGADAASLAGVDEAFLKAFFATRNEAPFVGGGFVFEEDRQGQSRAAVNQCRARREFRLLRTLGPGIAPDGGVAWGEYARYAIMLCEHGPLGPSQFQSTLGATQAMITQNGLPPALQEFAGFPLRIGNRTGRVAVLLGIGHGVIPAPLAVIPTSDARATLVIAMDDAHFGEPGHEVKRALADLADLLKAIDEQSGLSRWH
jgi:hypothetical protein